MKEVFISYSSIDASQAETVRNVLEKNGFSCWMAPRDIPGGSNYTKEIPIAIRNCKVFVLVLSKNAQSSHWVLKELDAAVNNGKVILPFMLEDCILNDEFNFLLTGAQRYAAYKKTAETMQLLISRIRGILDASGENAEEVREEIPEEAPAESAPVAVDPVVLTGAVCRSCGSSELKPLPKRVLRQGAKELATMLLIPIMGAAGFFVALIIVAATLWFELLVPLLLVGTVGGALWGDAISKKLVRRQRARSRIKFACYRCKNCDKIFRVDTPVE